MKNNVAALTKIQRGMDFELAQKLGGIVEIPDDLLARITADTYQRSDLVPLLRTALFSVLEHHGTYPQGSPFARWKSDAHELEHQKKCKGGKESWSTTDAVITPSDAREGDLRWFVLAELRRRADHLNTTTIPALKLGATCSVMPLRVHAGTCSKCSAIATASSVTVEVAWQGIVMRREYRV